MNIQHGGRCSLCSKTGHNKRTCRNQKKPKSKLSPKLTTCEQKGIVTSQIQSFITRQQLKKMTEMKAQQQKSFATHKHPGTRKVIIGMDKIIKKLEIRIQNLPSPLPATRGGRSQRGKKNFDVVDIMIDPTASQAVYTIINSIYASPAYVKIAETEAKDNVNQWISTNAHKYLV